MIIHNVVDVIKCKAFPITLKGVTRIWFSNLHLGSISTFEKLNEKFPKSLCEQ